MTTMRFDVESLIQELRSPNEETRKAAARRLGLLKNPVAVDALIAALSDISTPVASASIRSLVQIGEPALPALVDCLLDAQDSSVRYAVTMILGEMRHTESVPALIDALRDPNTDVQAGAAMALEGIGTSEALAEVMTWRAQSGSL